MAQNQGRPGDRGSAAYDERGEIQDPTTHTSRKLEFPRPTDPMPPITEIQPLVVLPRLAPERLAVYGIDAPPEPTPEPPIEKHP
jgi:hypothetical protein